MCARSLPRQLFFLQLELFYLWAACGAVHLGDRRGDLIGWKGETHLVGTRPETGHASVPSVEVLSWEPRAFIYHNFLSDEECDHLIANAKPHIRRSQVVNMESGGSMKSDVRTSGGFFYPRGYDQVTQAIESRIASWTLINETQGEGIQLLEYDISQKYDAHYDYFFHDQAAHNGGNRMATVLMYLNEPEFGGETVFPKAEPSQDQKKNPEKYSKCAMEGLAVKPRKGDALLFFSLTTTGELDRKSYHGGCPVEKGIKYSATKWIHVARHAKPGERAVSVQHKVFAPPPPPVTPGCVDKHKMCKSWAMQGECEVNPNYMLGYDDVEGGCLASCNACHLMKTKPHEEMKL